eukprot:scaffold1593_cov193-Alexandrium_tamarense.AAC.77
MLTRSIICALSLATSTAFIVPNTSTFIKRPSTHLLSKGDDVTQQHAFASGSFVEFEEKGRTHIGTIESVAHKSNGGTSILDSLGTKYDVPDKSVQYHMSAPNSPGQAAKLYDEFVKAQEIPLQSIQSKIDVTPELLEMAWEEAVDESEEDIVTAASFIELVHAHAASTMEKYYAWKLLQSDMAHIFFKEIKHAGRVIEFKAKSRKAVDAAKDVFCRNAEHADDEICFV